MMGLTDSSFNNFSRNWCRDCASTKINLLGGR